MDNPDQILTEVRHCLDHWGISAADIKTASLSENIVYQVTATDGAVYALRIHRPGYHTLNELVSEHEWTEALAEAGFAVPIAVPTLSGNFYVPVQVGDGERYAGVVRWLNKAVSLYELEQNGLSVTGLCDKLKSLGATMARMHLHTESWQPSAGFVRHYLDVDGFFGQQPFWGRYWEAPGISDSDRELLLTSQNRIAAQLTRLGQGTQHFGMIHADLHHGNVMFQGTEMVIIDFDDAGFGWFLYDIAVALNEYQRRDDFEVIKTALLSGYESVRPLNEGDHKMLPMFLHIRDRAIIGWAAARPELDNADRLAELIRYTRQQARHFL